MMVMVTTTFRKKKLDKVQSKSKFGRAAIEDKFSGENEDLHDEEEVRENKKFDFCVGKFHISVDCTTKMVILLEKFELEMRRLRSQFTGKQCKNSVIIVNSLMVVQV